MDKAETLYAALAAKAADLGRPLKRLEWLEEARKVLREVSKKSIPVAVEAEEIYQLYPRKVGKEDALKAISLALKKHEASYLKDKTNQFREAVESWPTSYRYFQDGGDRCPNPGTWYRQGRYADDPTTWRRKGAQSSAPHQKVSIPEPDGWRAEFQGFIDKDKPWHQLDRAQQEYISAAMKTAKDLTQTSKEIDHEQRLRTA